MNFYVNHIKRVIFQTFFCQSNFFLSFLNLESFRCNLFYNYLFWIQAKPGVTPKIPILVMELADGGNLYAYLRQCRERASQPCKPDEVYQSTANFNELVSICHQVVLGMKHLNEKKVRRLLKEFFE